MTGTAYTSLPPGYFSAVEVTGYASGLATDSNQAQSIQSFVDLTTSTTVGSGPILGREEFCVRFIAQYQPQVSSPFQPRAVVLGALANARLE